MPDLVWDSHEKHILASKNTCLYNKSVMYLKTIFLRYNYYFSYVFVSVEKPILILIFIVIVIKN